jgi:hypothetical protein
MLNPLYLGLLELTDAPIAEAPPDTQRANRVTWRRLVGVLKDIDKFINKVEEQNILYIDL